MGFESKQVRASLTLMLLLALLASSFPCQAMPQASWADELEDTPSLETQGGDVVDGESAVDGGGPGDVRIEEPMDGLDDAFVADAPSEEERRIMEGLSSLGTRLDDELGKLEKSKASLDGARAGYARGACVRDAISGVDEDAARRIEELDRCRLDVLTLMRMVQEELMQSEEFSTIALMTGASSPIDVELRRELLERLVVSQGKRIRQALGDQRRLRAELAIDGACARHERRESRACMNPVNLAAYVVERQCAHVRQCVSDARLAIEGATGSHPAFLEASDAMRSRAGAAMVIVEDAERAVGTWYEQAEASACVQDALAFGEGADFSLPEDEFVEIWGNAIDGFFASRAAASGDLPLRGYGRQMATSAYQHKIDPRLCAAVSIAESGGGQACIRPHNAWGWGAADSNPYGLAAEWDSFDEAIEAWHEGMARSTSGLATARTVSELGAIYCSSPTWGATVIEQMELISAFV